MDSQNNHRASLRDAFPSAAARADAIEAAALIRAHDVGVRLADLARFWIAHHPTPSLVVTVRDALAEYLRHKEARRARTLKQLEYLCRVFDHPTHAAADPTGEIFCFEKGAAKHGGGDGFADVWKRGFWGWEYKGKHKDLADAYDQLLR